MIRYWVILAGLLFVSCNSNEIYLEIHDLEDGFWNKDEIHSFTFEISDSKVNYDLFAVIRNSSSYPYSNIYLKYAIFDQTGNKKKEELKSFDLFDPKTGKPLGDGLGDLFDHELLIEKGYSFQSTGEFVVEISQYMRMDELPLILSVGLKINRVPSEE
jgi:gliding motility-associated lipoprotein GldH